MLHGVIVHYLVTSYTHRDNLLIALCVLCRVLVQCEWNVDALHQLIHVISLLQEPCLRQETLRFSFTIIQRILSSSSYPPAMHLTTTLPSPREANTQQLYDKSSELMLLGVTDVWSAIRKESAKQTAMLALQFPTMDVIDGFFERLLRIAVGSECVRQETSVQTRWGEQDGALHTLSLLLSSIRAEGRSLDEDLNLKQTGNKVTSSGAASRVASDIRGGFAGAVVSSAPVVHFNFGSRHPSVPRLPRSLVQSLKSVLYHCLRHEQLSVREHAAQCLKHYVDLCEEPMRLLIFQEAMSKLNRMKASPTADKNGVNTSSDDDHELLEAFEAEGLLDVLAKLAPSLPSTFLLKHWRLVFPTLERYVMHIASSVRQKSSAVVLSLAKLSQSGWASQTTSSNSGSAREAALQLLVEMMLGLSASQDHKSTAGDGGDVTILCWQQREGRMLSIEALVDLLGKDLLFRKFGARLLNGNADDSKKKSEAPVSNAKDELIWASSSASLATWTLGEDELADLTAATRQPEQADAKVKTGILDQPLVRSLTAFLAEKNTTRGETSLGATEFWHRVLSGWLQQTQVAFASNQFELRRISRQLLPGLLRLSSWTNWLELPQSQRTLSIEESGECWRWSCVKFLLLHIQFLQESVQMHSVDDEDEELSRVLQTGLESAWSLTSAVSNDKRESTDGGGSYDTELTIVRVEAQLMAFLSFSRSDGKEISSLGLLESSLSSVHANLPSHMQLAQYITPGRPSARDISSLDRQLSISLVRLLPSIARALSFDIAKYTSEDVGDWMKPPTKCWLILERSVLSWLTTDDMFRWITVDHNEAQLSLLKTLDILLHCVPASRREHFSNLDAEFELVLKQLERIGVLVTGESQQRLSKESTLTHALSICLSMWKNSTSGVGGGGGGGTIDSRCCQGIVQVYAQLAALSDKATSSSHAKSSSSQSGQSSWDDWDGDGDEPGELGSNKTSQLRATASAGERGGGGAADQLFSYAVSGWSSEQLSALHASISASTADAHALLALADSLRS